MNIEVEKKYSANGDRSTANFDAIKRINFSLNSNVTFVEIPDAEVLKSLSPNKSYCVRVSAVDLLNRSLDISQLDISQAMEVVFSGHESLMDLILNRLKDFTKAPRITIEPLRTKFSPSFLKHFTAEQKSQLHFEFKPFDPRYIDSWSVPEIRKMILEITALGIKVRPPLNYDVLPPTMNPSDLLAEPIEPTFEFKIADSHPKWSVILPTYNNGSLVPAVVWSLLKQSLPRAEFEIILVDDASEDNPEVGIRKLIEPEFRNINFKFLRINKPHRSANGQMIYRAGVARNLGYRWSTGENILFLDSDTVIDSQLLERWSELLKTHQLVQATRKYVPFSRYERLPSHAELKSRTSWMEDENYLKPFYNCQDWQTFACAWKYVCTYALAVRRQEVQEFGLFRPSFVTYGFEDVELGFRWFKNGAKFYLDRNEPVLHLCEGPSKRQGLLNQMFRHYALSKSAKVLFRNTLDLEIFNELYPYMWGESKTLRKVLGREVNKWP